MEIPSQPSRCAWAKTPLSIAYHDQEWGTPLHDERKLFEFLILEGAQAGLSWETILQRRAAYRRAMDHFDPICVADYDDQKITALLADPGIIRNRRKIQSAIQNARAFRIIQQEIGSFDHYLWGFVEHQPLQNAWKTLAEIPALTPLSTQFSKDLIRRGFSFVGPTICYALMQAVGMVNDHLVDCFRYADLQPSTAHD